MEDFEIKVQITDASGKYTLFLIEYDDELLIAITFVDDPSQEMFVIEDVDVWTVGARKPAFLSPGCIIFTDMDENVIVATGEENADRKAKMAVTIKPKDKKLYEEAVSLLLDYDVDVEFI